MSLRFSRPALLSASTAPGGCTAWGPATEPSASNGAASRAAFHTPTGPATLEAQQRTDQVLRRALGRGGGLAVGACRSAARAQRRTRPCSPRTDPRFRSVWKRTLGIYLPTLPVLFPRLAQVILLQLVTTGEGQRAWSRIVRDMGHAAPGPHDLRLPPRSEDVAASAWVRYVADGVPHKQARTLVRCARTVASLEASGTWGGEEAMRAVETLRGIGPWSVGYLRGTGLGRPGCSHYGRLPSAQLGRMDPGRKRARHPTRRCWS